MLECDIMITGHINNIYYGRVWYSNHEKINLFNKLLYFNVKYIINLLPNDPSIEEEKEYFNVINIPISDLSIPEDANLAEIANIKENIFVHCLAGIGRTSLVVAELLKLKGYSEREALIYVQNNIGGPETQEQINYILRKEK
jgi:protein-tyrosine phosphatase